MKKQSLLEVQNLSCERNYRLLFKNLSFKLLPGKMVIVNGNNGSGKSSLLLCISGVLDFKGKIKIEKKYSNKIGYVGHQNALNESDTITEFLTFWKKVYNYNQNINNIIKNFDLENYKEAPIGFLSFGQKKKLSFARLQMVKSKIWLLDEPLSGLDKKTESLILNLIQEHNNYGGGVVATSHQRLAFFNNKKIMRIKIG